jgi:GTPase
MSLPKVVIIGRPNVGKSTLFNRLVGKRLALVDDTPGVTRDRREGEARLFDFNFIAVDTAGLEEADDASLAGRMRQQTHAALQDAQLALMVIDARAGITPLDRFFGDWVRAQNLPVLLVANKCEGRNIEAGLHESYALGLGDPIPVSAEHGQGMVDVYHAICGELGYAPEEKDEPAPKAEPTESEVEAAPLRLAIIGRPNAGKSTLINSLLGENRLVTGPEAGITRDSISIDWSWQARPVKLIDTAGLRKRAKVNEKLEWLSAADTKRSVDFAEVVVLLLDATRGLEAQDLRIAAMALEEGRALLVALNKWDAVEDHGGTYRGVKAALEDGLSQVKGLSLLTLSGLTGKNLDVLMQAAFELRTRWSRRVPTAALNRWFGHALERNPPPAPGGRRIKLRYVTQVRTRPPSFLIFGNRTEELPDSYTRYLLNNLRDDLDLPGVPIRLGYRGGKNPYDKG